MEAQAVQAPSPTLTDEELREITGYRQPAKQLAELHRLGYFRARRSPTTGRIIVERLHYEAVIAGRAAEQPRQRPKLQPA